VRVCAGVVWDGASSTKGYSISAMRRCMYDVTNPAAACPPGNTATAGLGFCSAGGGGFCRPGGGGCGGVPVHPPRLHTHRTSPAQALLTILADIYLNPNA
jgi:hypothetical protein